MLSRRSIIALLVGLNVLLGVIMLAGARFLPTASAAGKGARAGDFMCVTAKPAGQSFDVVYILDKAERKLHAFYPTSARAPKYSYGKSRDLGADFGR